MKKFLLLGIFGFITAASFILFLVFRKVNSVDPELSLDKTLDFSKGYDVKLDIEYLRNNILPAHE